MMKNLTEEEKSQSYFFIFIVVGVATILGVSFLIINYQIEEHIEEYHMVQVPPRSTSVGDAQENTEDQVDSVVELPSEESVEDIFDDGDVFEDEDMDIIDGTDELDEIQVDDITL